MFCNHILGNAEVLPEGIFGHFKVNNKIVIVLRAVSLSKPPTLHNYTLPNQFVFIIFRKKNTAKKHAKRLWYLYQQYMLGIQGWIGTGSHWSSIYKLGCSVITPTHQISHAQLNALDSGAGSEKQDSSPAKLCGTNFSQISFSMICWLLKQVIQEQQIKF